MVSFKFISATALAVLYAATSVQAAAVNPFVGETTYYIPSEVGGRNSIGACGTMIKDSDYSAAVSYKLFDTFSGAGPNPNENPICGKALRAHYKGKTVTVKVVDRCHDCEGKYNVDMTKTAFQELEPDLDVGRLRGVQWEWV